jgi:Ca2+-binding EF-hand superfamily protein
MKQKTIANCNLFFLVVLCLPAEAAEKPRPAKDQDVQDLVFLADSRPLLIRLHVQVEGRPLMQAWDEFVGHVFAQSDLNKDGVLDAEEAARVPPPASLFGARGGFNFVNVGGGGTPTAGLDANKDGKVTREELADYFRRNGGAPFSLVQGSAADQDVNIRRVALDSLGALPSSGSADALNKALLALLDTDKDGKLSLKELAAAPTLLLKKDADDDEMVTSGEILGQGPVTQTGYRVFLSRSMSMPVSADGPVLAVTAGEPNRALAEKLLTRYGHKKPTTSSKLARKDLNLSEGAFARLDADEDGLLDREELARFARRKPDVELMVRIGKDKDAEVSLLKGRKPPEGVSVTARKQGVSVRVGNTEVQLNVGGGQQTTIRLAPSNRADVYKRRFSAADGDNNGYLDMNEAGRNRFFRSLFKAMDADGDGMLYLKEVLAYFEKQEALQDRAQKSCITMSLADQGKGLFDLLDRNGDGRLSVRELRDAVKQVRHLDLNKDGKIESSEIPRRFSLTARQGPSGGGGGFGAVVALGYGGGRPQRVPELTAGPLWFRKMDRNRDGDVSRREFLGSPAMFARIDTDGDGLIDAQEAEKADSLFRKKR